MNFRHLFFVVLGVASAGFSLGCHAVEGIDDVSPAYETYGVHYQSTYVWQKHSGFNAPYTGNRSMVPGAEKSYTFTATAYLGARLWQGAEIYFNPELIQSSSLSNLTGLAGLSNSENQKGSGANPVIYPARLFLRQVWGLGGATEKLESGQNQLAGEVDKRRVVLTVGKVALIDIFDINSFSRDPRTQFLNWALITHGGFDYAADSRGYTVGAALEYFADNWVIRMGRFEQPKVSNGLALDSNLREHYGDQIEIEHGYTLLDQPGRFHTTVFRNRANMGNFQEALVAWRAGGSAGVPDVANVRANRIKYGYGLNVQQNFSEDVGGFAGASWNDGQSETYAFTEIERSAIVGLQIKGNGWDRPSDTVGLALVQNGLSDAHRAYLAAGGLGFFIGDGKLNYRPEQIFEGYYSLYADRHIWLSFDYQHVVNPAYNADRGPIDLFAGRLHFEY